jgi:hypothetical protein
VTETRRKLMQFHDGELGALPTRQVERQLAWDARGRRYLDSLDSIGDGVRDAMRQATPTLDLTDRIMAQVTLQDRELEGLTPSRSGPAASAPWQRKLSVALGVGLGSTAALAAAAVFWLSVGMPSDSEAEVTLTARALETTPASDADIGRGVAIESVDFGMGGGSIFMVQVADTPTPVVWLTEPPEVEVGSEPL